MVIVHAYFRDVSLSHLVNMLFQARRFITFLSLHTNVESAVISQQPISDPSKWLSTHDS
jgi:hypothetical protein